ncbi:MAG: Uncharacterised protein [Prochlorococcus marinus str. MIT 9215]|nr:MAG: Uncharacterised protein [Prochlorococcus marinus str. MIT 9215]
MTITPSRGVAIKTQQAQPFELLTEMLQNPLCSSPERFEGLRTTMTTAGLQLGAMVTPMATQPLMPLPPSMDSQRHITVGALDHLPTTTAIQKAAVAAPWHQHHSLLACFRQGRQTLHERATNQPTMTISQFLTHVDDMHRRQGLIRDALSESSQRQGAFRRQALPGCQ